jgi:hypothetical protein
VSPHDLRRSFGRILYARELNVNTIRALYNHATTEQTLYYIGETLDGMREAVGTFDTPRPRLPRQCRCLPRGFMCEGHGSEVRSARPSFVITSESCPFSTATPTQRSFDDIATRLRAAPVRSSTE